MIIGQRDRADRLREILRPQRIDQGGVEQPADALALHRAGDVDRGLDDPAIRLALAEARGIGISEHAIVVAVGRDQPGVEAIISLHPSPHRARIGRFGFERSDPGQHMRRIDRSDGGRITRASGADGDHRASFARIAFIRLTSPGVGSAGPSAPHSRQRAWIAAPFDNCRISPSTWANTARR